MSGPEASRRGGADRRSPASDAQPGARGAIRVRRPTSYVFSPTIFFGPPIDESAAHVQNRRMDAPFVIESDASLERGIFYGLIFVTPFWIVVVTLLVALTYAVNGAA
jgi:hypothetical protein